MQKNQNRFFVVHPRIATILTSICILVGCATPKHKPFLPSSIFNLPFEKRIQALSEQWWNLWLLRWPNEATYLGDHRYDALLPDLSSEAQDEFVENVGEIARATALIPEHALSENDQLTRKMLLWTLQRVRDSAICKRSWWTIDQLYGPWVWLAELPSYHRIGTKQDVDNLVKRYENIVPFLKQYQDNLLRGAKEGWVAPRILADLVVKQVEQLLLTKPEHSSFMEVVKRFPNTWDKEQQKVAKYRLLGAVKNSMYPAFDHLLKFLKHYSKNISRNSIGIFNLPQGDKCYANLIQYGTGSKLSPLQIHKVGLDEIARLHKAMLEVAKQIDGPSTDLKFFLSNLRKRQDQYLKSKDEFIARGQMIMLRAQKELGRMFGRLPKTPLEVKAMPELRAKYAPSAYYFEAPDDNSRPAFISLNTYDLSSQPLYGLDALVFHEGIPGHHLQKAIAKEQAKMPMFRQQLGQTAFTEGWALYAEQLADEMGLYTNVLSRFGYLNYQAWRAARLVIDTGIHALGWSREKAIQYLKDNTALSHREAVNEIDRYIVWPAQALSYVLGRMTFQRLRKQAEQILGQSFDIREFHDEILRHGSIPLNILEEIVLNWTKTR